VVWKLEEAGFHGSPESHLGRIVVSGRNQVRCLDLKTGHERWRAATEPEEPHRGQWGLVLERIVLFVEYGPDCFRFFDLESGRRLWKLERRQGQNQRTLGFTWDGRTFWYADGEGQIHARRLQDGAKLWVCRIGGEALWIGRVGGRLLVPYSKGLAALDARSGRILWNVRVGEDNAFGFVHDAW
jgi:glucose dehydrogenase